MHKKKHRGLTRPGKPTSIGYEPERKRVGIRKRTLSTLRQECERLEAERQKIDMQLEKMKALIALEEVGAPAKRIRLRPHILDLILANSGKLTATEIARDVELSGYKPKGYTSTRTLVYSELARLVRQRKVYKDKQGRVMVQSEMGSVSV